MLNKSERFRNSYPRVKARIPTCHPERKHLAKGLCASCYEQTKYNYKNRGLPRRKRGLWELYKLTLEEYDSLLLKQNGVCAICKQFPSGNGNGKYLHVDHDHKTGKIRGLLCGTCNTAIGALHEDLVLLSRAIEYLKEEGNV